MWPGRAKSARVGLVARVAGPAALAAVVAEVDWGVAAAAVAAATAAVAVAAMVAVVVAAEVVSAAVAAATDSVRARKHQRKAARQCLAAFFVAADRSRSSHQPGRVIASGSTQRS